MEGKRNTLQAEDSAWTKSPGHKTSGWRSREGGEENVTGSILEMLIDVFVRYNLSCRQLDVGHAAQEGGLNMGVICMWIVRGDQVTQGD